MPKLQYVTDSPHTRGWAERIGRLIMNFSGLELQSIEWLVHLTDRHEDAGRFFAQKFNSRIVQIERCIEVRSTDKEWRRKALRSWNDARRLSGIRNQVAHNPLAFWWKDPAERGEPDFVYIASMRGAGRNPKEMLGRQKADDAGNELAALVKRLTGLREEWCAQRDRGLVPAAPEPEELWPRIRARAHRWMDRVTLSMAAAIRESNGGQ